MADIIYAPAAGVDESTGPAATLTVGGAVVEDDGWRAYVVERDGTVVTELTDANLGSISEKINGWPTFDFELSKASADAADCQRVVREVAVYRDGGNPKFVGPILQRSADSGNGAMRYSCAGVGWYLSRRLGSNFANGNLLINPRFDDGFANWFNTGVTLDAVHETGTQSVEFAGVGTGEIRQTVTQAISGQATIVVEARVWVLVGTPGTWRLYIDVFDGPDTYVEITPDYVTGWQTVTCTLDVDLSSAEVAIRVGIDTVGGDSMLVDRMACYLFSAGSDTVIEPEPYQAADDQVQVIRSVIQDRNAGLNLGVNTPATDILVFHKPQVDADSDAIEIANRYTKTDTGIEWSIVCTPGTRTFTTHYPRMGRTIPDSETVLRTVAGGGDPRNCISYDLSEDASEAVSQMTTLGDSVFRGIATDLDAWDGLLLQSIQQAPAGTYRDDLEGISLRALRTSVGETQVLTVVVDDGTLMDTVLLGDRVDVVIDDWDVQIADTYRVVARRLDPKTDTMSLTLNPEPA